MKRPSAQTIAAVVALAVLGIIALLAPPRPQTADVASYASTDYRAGGYRAWAALMTSEGVATMRFVLRLIELDGRIDTLVSAQPPANATMVSARSAADIAALAAWVRAGGRLVYLGRNAGVTRAENSSLALPFLVPGVGSRGRLSGALAAFTGSVPGLGADRMLLVEHPGSIVLADSNGEIAVRYPLGRGEIVAVADGMPFTNAEIGEAGNARLAYLLARPRAPGGTVAFDDGLHGALIDRPWYRALPLPVRITLAIGACAALLGLIGGALRSGAPVRLTDAREPTSAEFVDALAMLYERRAARADALALCAGDALTAAARANGCADRATPAEIAARIGERRGADDVRRLGALLAAPVASDVELLSGARLAHAVRKEWTHGGYGDGRRAAFAGRARTRRRR